MTKRLASELTQVDENAPEQMLRPLRPTGSFTPLSAASTGTIEVDESDAPVETLHPLRRCVSFASLSAASNATERAGLGVDTASSATTSAGLRAAYAEADARVRW